MRTLFLIRNGYKKWEQSCYNISNLTLDQADIRSIIRQNDAIFQNGGGPDENCTHMVTTTGSDGSGWYLVAGSETVEYQDDHCFHYGEGFRGSRFDAEIQDGAGVWALPSSLD